MSVCYGDPAPNSLAQFMARIEVEGDCWIWTGACGEGGRYGFFRRMNAHRWAYLRLACLEIPEGMQLHHRCRRTRCVNPDHVEPATPRENVLQSDGLAAANARKTHCKRGHALAPDNLTEWGLRRGRRACATCNEAYNERRKAERRAA